MVKKMCEKLRELIPRQQFDIPFKRQWCKVISRETIKSFVKTLLLNVMVIFLVNVNFRKTEKKGKENAFGRMLKFRRSFMAVLKLDKI
jgi:GTP-binding protein LepA